MNFKVLFRKMIVAIILGLGGIAVFVAIVDPYFHYHAPYEMINYRLVDERYINSGIAKHFEYNALITGTSMTENFKTSEFDALFATNSIKVPLEGSSYNEINEIITIALKSNPELKMVLRGIDSSGLVADKNKREYAKNQWPGYLYDENPINDIKYLLNGEAVKRAAINCYMTIAGVPSMTFDEYANWSDASFYGADFALAAYERPEVVEEKSFLSDEERKMVLENVQQNLTAVAAAYPEVTFYYYITPVSILYWDKLGRLGKVDWYVEAERIAIEEMLQYPNIKLFSFYTYLDVVGDLSYYKDVAHHWGKTNSNLLNKMKEEQFMLTSDNYEAYLNFLHETYNNYDYEAIFAEE